MKVKTWHIGCLVVLIAAALYFLVGTREGLDNSATCWDIADPTAGKFLDVRALITDSLMLNNNIKVNHCKPASSPGPLTPSEKVCLADAGMYFSLEEAQAACANDGLCTAIVGSPARPGSPFVTIYLKYGGNATIVPFDTTPGRSFPYMINQKAYIKKPCASSSLMPPGPTGTAGGASMTPPVSAPMPPGPTGTAGGSSMTPTLVPVPSTAAGTSYNLTCTAAPVSGMVGSAAAMPETPAAWNVTQPPSGWNSKNGYTTTGN